MVAHDLNPSAQETEGGGSLLSEFQASHHKTLCQFLLIYLKKKIRGWRDNSVVISPGCSSRGPRDNSQHADGSSQM